MSNPRRGTITSPAWRSTPIQLIPDNRRVFGSNDPTPTAGSAGASPSGLAADGSGFTVTWQANPAVAG